MVINPIGELSEQEFNAVVKEMTERIKDIVYMNLEQRVREILQEILKKNPHTDDIISFTWEIRFVFNDVVQIVGRIRRCQDG